MYIKVRVTPKSKKEYFEETGELHFKMGVREPAERNRANKRVLEVVADHFKVPVGAVRIVNGHRSPSKLISIDDDSLDN